MRSFLVLGVMLCLVACGETTREQTPAEIARLIQLTHERTANGVGATRAAQDAAIELGQLRDASAEVLPRLIQLLRTHTDSQMRHFAAIALNDLEAPDAIPVLIDSLSDGAGANALLFVHRALEEATGAGFQLEIPFYPNRMVELQRKYRAWWAENETALRTRLGSTRRIRISHGTPAPAHNADATAASIVGNYISRRWTMLGLLQLQGDGRWILRSVNLGTLAQLERGERPGLVIQPSCGRWSLTREGIELTWSSHQRGNATIGYLGGPLPPPDPSIKTLATWANNVIYMYPECRAPYSHAFGHVTAAQLKELPEKLRAPMPEFRDER